MKCYRLELKFKIQISKNIIINKIWILIKSKALLTEIRLSFVSQKGVGILTVNKYRRWNKAISYYGLEDLFWTVIKMLILNQVMLHLGKILIK